MDPSIDISYAKSPTAVFKVLQILCDLTVVALVAVPICLPLLTGYDCIGFISRFDAYYMGWPRNFYLEAYGQAFVIAVAALGVLVSVGLLIVFLSQLHKSWLQSLPMTFVDVVLMISFSFLLLVAFALECFYSTGNGLSFDYWTNRLIYSLNDLSQWKVCAAFAFLAFLFYSIDAVYLSIRWCRLRRQQKQQGSLYAGSATAGLVVNRGDMVYYSKQPVSSYYASSATDADGYFTTPTPPASVVVFPYKEDSV